MNGNTEIKIGTILSYVQMAIGVIVSLVYTPLLLRFLGKSEYGLYNTVYSTISMLSFLSLGFAASYIRYFSKYKKENDFDKISKLNGMFLIIFTIIGIVAFFVGIIITLNLRIVFDNGLNDNEYKIAEKLMLLLVIEISISFPVCVFTNIISAHEKFVYLKIVSIFKTLFAPLFTLPFLYAGYKSVAMVLVTLIVSLLSDVLYVLFVFLKLKQRFVFKRPEKSIIFDMFVFTIFIAINIIVDQINWNVDKIVLGRFIGVEAVAVYSVGYTIYQYFQLISTSFSSMFTPKIHKMVNTISEKEKLNNELTNLFTFVGKIQFVILALILTGFAFFGRVFVELWAGEGYDDSYLVALILMMASLFPFCQNLGIEIQRSLNLHKFRSVAYVIMAIINLVVTILICQKYGPVGASVVTAFSLLIANIIIMNIYYHKKCGINILFFWKKIIRLSCGLIIPLVLGFIIINVAQINGWLNLLLFVTIYSIVYIVSIYFVGVNRCDRGKINEAILGFCNKSRRS